MLLALRVVWVLKFLYHLCTVVMHCLGTEVSEPSVWCILLDVYYLGTAMIVGMQAKRNIVNTEKSAINFIYKKPGQSNCCQFYNWLKTQKTKLQEI